VIEGIEKYDLPRSVTGKDLLPEHHRSFQAWKNRKRRLGRHRAPKNRSKQYENKGRAKIELKSHDPDLNTKN
jgi:hypothetical protein